MWFLKKWALLSFFAFAICFVAANPVHQSESQSIDIAYLNDDVFYGIFAYLDLDDLENIINLNERLVPIVRYTFSKKAWGVFESWKNNLFKKAQDLRRNVGHLLRLFTPKDDAFGDEKLFLLFKLLTYLSPSYHIEIEAILKPCVDGDINLGRNNHLENFAKSLTLFDHDAVLRHILPGIFSERLAYAYMMILEKSKEHLKNQFTYAMMLKMDRIRNAANAFTLLHNELNSNDSTIEYHERFPLDWDLYKNANPSSEDTKGKLHLVLAKDTVKAVQDLNRVSPSYELPHEDLQAFSRAYCAIRSLSGPHFVKLVDETNLNLAFFDLATDNVFVEKLRNSLGKECAGSKILETGLQQQIDNLDKLTGEKTGNPERFFTVMSYYFVDREYYLKLVSIINDRIENLERSTDFSDYIKLLKACMFIGKGQITYTMTEIYRDMYFAYFTFVDRPSAFADVDQLNEVDRLHRQLFSQYKYYQRVETWQEKSLPLLGIALENFRSILSPSGTDTPEKRTKQRIVLKMLIFLAKNAYQRHADDGNVGNADVEKIFKVEKMFYALAHMDGQILSEDNVLLSHWNHFHLHMNPQATQLYLLTDVAEFAFMYHPYELTGVLAKDVFVYLCHLNTANYLHLFERPLPDQMLENILSLEESIGDAASTEPFLQSEVSQKKFQFYIQYSDEVRRKLEHGHLKKYIESMIDLLLSRDDEEQTKIVSQVYVAIANNRETIAEQLGEELVEKLKSSFFSF